MRMTVKDVLKNKNRNLVTVLPTLNVVEAMGMLIEHRIGCLLIVNETGRLLGILSDMDLFHAVYKSQDKWQISTAGDLMTKNLIVGVIDDDIDYIAGLMTKNRVRHIPIVDKDKLIGLVSIGDIVKNQIQDIEVENRYLKAYIDGSYPG